MFTDYLVDSELLSRAIIDAGYESVAEFARVSGVHRNTLLEYLSGERSALPVALARLSAELGIDPYSLVRKKTAPQKSYDQTKDIIKILRSLAKGRPKLAFVLIGSRARGNARENSDFDIAMTSGKSTVQTSEYLKVKSELEDLCDHLPVSVDLVNLDVAPRWFLAEMTYDPIFLAGNAESFSYLQGVLDGIRKTKEN